MTEREIKELKVWICVNVFGWTINGTVSGTAGDEPLYMHPDTSKGYIIKAADCLPDYPADPAANRELESMIIDRHGSITLSQPSDGGKFWYSATACGKTAEAETLELAICLLARKIYKQKET